MNMATRGDEEEGGVEEWISDIIAALGKHAERLGGLAEKLLAEWNKFATGREAHRERMATLASEGVTRFLRYGVAVVIAFTFVAAVLVYVRNVSADAFMFFMGTVIGYLFAYFARSGTTPGE
jgi:hypothetical protein